MSCASHGASTLLMFSPQANSMNSRVLSLRFWEGPVSTTLFHYLNFQGIETYDKGVKDGDNIISILMISLLKCWWGCKLIQPMRKTKAQHMQTFISSTYKNIPNKMYTYVHPKTYTQLHLRALFLKLENTQLPSIVEQINKSQYIHAMNHFTAIKIIRP